MNRHPLRRLCVAVGLVLLFLAGTAIETAVVLPAQVRDDLMRAVVAPISPTSSRS
ncbi:MAG TPA: hypothetical protein VMU79_13420 [Casimicrobiaceae bacterium]|jgi:hypothetical protein|nr:hypothetical protein [Casimicrobiaceae bacterium]